MGSYFLTSGLYGGGLQDFIWQRIRGGIVHLLRRGRRQRVPDVDPSEFLREASDLMEQLGIGGPVTQEASAIFPSSSAPKELITPAQAQELAELAGRDKFLFVACPTSKMSERRQLEAALRPVVGRAALHRHTLYLGVTDPNMELIVGGDDNEEEPG
tara:strand:+ start:62 stop:532 length:471 start_codon:yes stop_codon:yes gene_type:complete